MIDHLFRVTSTLRRSALIGYWILMFLATHWPDIERYRPEEGWPLPHFDFYLHVTVYAIWTMLWFWVLQAHVTIRERTYVTFFILGMVYAVFDESSQALVDRTPSFNDLAYNLIGMTLGAVISHLLIRRFRARR